MIAIASRRQLRCRGLPPAAPDSFLSRLASYDRELEVFFDEDRILWMVYRRFRDGFTKSEDMLVHIADLESPTGDYRPLGDWVIPFIQKKSLFAKWGTHDIDLAARYEAELMERHDDMREELAEKRFMDQIHDVSIDVERYGARGKTHGPAKKKPRKKPVKV
jgi:hypothetical protein